MSNNHSTLYPQVPVDREAAIALIHGLQVDLALLAAMLAREPEPTLHQYGIVGLEHLRQQLKIHIPESRRH